MSIDSDHTSIECLLRPRSVAVVGASGQANRIGGLIVRLLSRHGFTGDIFPVNPKYDTLDGLPCYPDVGSLPSGKPVDLAFLYLPAEAVPDALRQCGQRGVRSAVVLSSGFAEIGSAGEALQAQIARIADEFGMRIAGPNCAGIANFREHFVAYGTTNFIDLEEILSGEVAVLTASGGFGNTIFTYCQQRRIGLSHLIGLGNEAVTNSAEFLDALIFDPEVSVVLANLESIRDPAAFLAAADRAAEQRKPIVVLKGGRSEAGRHAIITHTAALGGSPESFAGAFRQHGIIQVTDLDELVDVATLLLRTPLETGKRIGVFSLAGGGTGLLSDLAGDRGFTLPGLADETLRQLRELLPAIATVGNPLDPTAGFARDSERLRAGLKLFASDPHVDIVVFFPLASQQDYAQQLADDVIAVSHEIDKPIIVIWTAGRILEAGAWRTLHDAGVALFTDASDAFLAMARTRDYARFLERAGTQEARDLGRYQSVSPRAEDLVEAGTRPFALLERFGIRGPRSLVATSPTQAKDAVTQWGPCAMKIVSPDIAHKTDVGGVRLGVSDPEEASQSFDEILAKVASTQPGARVHGIEVQQMVGEGLELLLGVQTDDQLGPVLTVGLGGVLAELLRDTSRRPVPITRSDAHQMVSELRGAGLFESFRGAGKRDLEAVIEAMLGLSALAHNCRAAGPEIDVNPLVVFEEGRGALAVDALVRFRDLAEVR